MAAGVLLTVLHCVALDSAPPGLYNDEASIGYNAWAVAHHGIDEHGEAWPLFFEAFGEYKGPVYIYTLAPLTWLFPLSPALVRFPSALSSLGICVFAGLLAWRITRLRPVTLLVLLTAGLEPWLFIEGRTALEANIQMVLALVIALWCFVQAEQTKGSKSLWWFAGCGGALTIALFAYTPARLFCGVVVVVIAAAWSLTRRRRLAWWPLLPPLVAGYALMLIWSGGHPGALIARLQAVGIAYDHPSLLTLATRFAGNYLDYLSFPFLFTRGDGNPRHNTGYGGMLLVTTAPVIVAGLVVCLRRRRETVPCATLLGTAAGPIPAALTMEGTPHSLRAATMLPFLLLLAIYGWAALLRLFTESSSALRKSTRLLIATSLTVVAVVEVGGYLYDAYIQWPRRALTHFDAGEGDAIARAHEMAAGKTVIVSDTFDVPHIQAYFRLLPDPHEVAQRGLAALHMRELPAQRLDEAAKGDVLVLAPQDPVPPQAQLLEEEKVIVNHPLAQVFRPDSEVVVLASIWRMR